MVIQYTGDWLKLFALQTFVHYCYYLIGKIVSCFFWSTMGVDRADFEDVSHERKFLFLTTPGNSQIASVRFPFPKDRKNFVIAFPILNFGRNEGS